MHPTRYEHGWCVSVCVCLDSVTYWWFHTQSVKIIVPQIWSNLFDCKCLFYSRSCSSTSLSFGRGSDPKKLSWRCLLTSDPFNNPSRSKMQWSHSRRRETVLKMDSNTHPQTGTQMPLTNQHKSFVVPLGFLLYPSKRNRITVQVISLRLCHDCANRDLELSCCYSLVRLSE